MAKELPYFKFEPAEYLTKDISFCSISAQGLFINICSYYWQRQCSLTLEQISRRFNYPNELDELIDEGIIDVTDNTISIKFLDNQLTDVSEKSKTNSINGSKGGRPKKNPIETETKPNLNPNESETKGIREDKIKEDKIIIDVDAFLNWFNEMKLKYVGTKGKFTSINKTTINNLTKLKQQNLLSNEWEHAFKMMCANDWVVENQMQTPTHFLANDNFFRYLNQQQIEKEEYEDEFMKNVYKQINLNK